MRRLAVVVAVAIGALAAPAPAFAHGLVAREDLPIPEWLFGWGAAVVLLVSFVALAVLWPGPRLQQEGWRALPDWFSRPVTSQPVESVCGAVGAFLLGVVVWSGLRGAPNAFDNLAPSFVYITFWLGFVPVSLLFGDAFRAFNPWRAIGRGVGWAAKQAGGGSLPEPLAYLASDPLGDGSDLFGTAAWTVNYAWISGTTFWYIQVAVVVLGHAAALALAHDRALVTYPGPKLAVRSQYWMLAVMIGFTTLALWLLSEGSKG